MRNLRQPGAGDAGAGRQVADHHRAQRRPATAAFRIAAARAPTPASCASIRDVVLWPASSSRLSSAALRDASPAFFPTVAGNADLTAVVNERHLARVEGYLADAVARGARVESSPAEPVVAGAARCGSSSTRRPGRASWKRRSSARRWWCRLRRGRRGHRPHQRPPAPAGLYYFGEDAAEQQQVLDNTLSGGVTINEAMFHAAMHDAPFGGSAPPAWPLPRARGLHRVQPRAHRVQGARLRPAPRVGMLPPLAASISWRRWKRRSPRERDPDRGAARLQETAAAYLAEHANARDGRTATRPSGRHRQPGWTPSSCRRPSAASAGALAEAAVLLEESGRQLTRSPLFSGVALTHPAAGALRQRGGRPGACCRRWRRALHRHGDRRPGLSPFVTPGWRSSARRDGDGWVDGSARTDGDTADTAFVVARAWTRAAWASSRCRLGSLASPAARWRRGIRAVPSRPLAAGGAPGAEARLDAPARWTTAGRRPGHHGPAAGRRAGGRAALHRADGGLHQGNASSSAARWRLPGRQSTAAPR